MGSRLQFDLFLRCTASAGASFYYGAVAEGYVAGAEAEARVVSPGVLLRGHFGFVPASVLRHGGTTLQRGS